MVDTAVPPSCPASPTATASFCSDRWHIIVDTERWSTTLDRRERAVRALRTAGDARAADAVGWLSLAAILAGIPARIVGGVLSHRDSAALVDRVALAVSGGFGALRDAPDGPPGRHLAPCGLEVSDAGSRNGWAIAEMAGRAAGGAVVVVDGHPVTPSSFRSLLRQRLDDALGTTEERG